jgi:hypothetical protein
MIKRGKNNMRKQTKIGKLSKAELRALRSQIDTALARKRREIEAQLSLLDTVIGHGHRRSRKTGR